MMVQKIYTSWAFFGFAILPGLALTLLHTVLVWQQSKARWLSLISFMALVATQIIFWAYTYPMNALTKTGPLCPIISWLRVGNGSMAKEMLSGDHKAKDISVEIYDRLRRRLGSGVLPYAGQVNTKQLRASNRPSRIRIDADVSSFLTAFRHRSFGVGDRTRRV
jgi:hypothetical protein